MKINWNDFVIVYILGAVVYSLSSFLGSFIALIVLPVPGAFYFFRNSCDTKQALITSALFGFTFLPIITIGYLGVLFFIEKFFSGPNMAGGTWLIPSAISLILVWGITSTILTISTLIPFVVIKLLRKPKDIKKS